MTNIISFNDNHIYRKKTDRMKERKLLAVQKIFQCVRCAFKCEKCGANLEPNPRQDSTKNETFLIPYKFCEVCRDDYIEYIRFHTGRQNLLDYWRNDQWADLWKKWIEYQAAMDGYLKSREFKQLLLECRGKSQENEED